MICYKINLSNFLKRNFILINLQKFTRYNKNSKKKVISQKFYNQKIVPFFNVSSSKKE